MQFHCNIRTEILYENTLSMLLPKRCSCGGGLLPLGTGSSPAFSLLQVCQRGSGSQMTFCHGIHSSASSWLFCTHTHTHMHTNTHIPCTHLSCWLSKTWQFLSISRMKWYFILSNLATEMRMLHPFSWQRLPQAIYFLGEETTIPGTRWVKLQHSPGI